MSTLIKETPSEQAKKQGLTYAGWGKWTNASGKVVAKTIKNKLVFFSTIKNSTKNNVISKQIMHRKIGSQKGSTPGGIYLGTDGIKRYVKFYKDPSKAQCEHLSNVIYKLLGVQVPRSMVFKYKNSIGYASAMINSRILLDDIPPISRPKLAHKILDGFVADVFLSNWDVIGFSNDNILIDAAGTPIRVDNGGSLLFRATAGRKPTNNLNNIKDWFLFSTPSINPTYANLFKYANYKNADDPKFRLKLKAQIIRLVKLRKKINGNWKSLIKKIVPNMNQNDVNRINSMLDSKFKQIIKHYNKLK